VTKDGEQGLLDIPCVILAGGTSERFGSPKGLAKLQGSPLVEYILLSLKKQTSAQIRINASQDSPYNAYGRLIEDPPEFRSIGPLAGIMSALLWARQQGYDRVVTVPIDSPLLPSSLLRKFQDRSPPTFAATGDGEHYVTGLWPVSLCEELRVFLQSGQRSVRGWIEMCAAKPCLFDCPNNAIEFTNINTLADLEALERALERKTKSKG